MENADLRLEPFAKTLADTQFREPPTQNTVGSILDGDNEAVIMGLLRTIYLANSGYGGHLISRSWERNAAQELVFRSVRHLDRLSYTPTVPQCPSATLDRACSHYFHSPTSEAKHSGLSTPGRTNEREEERS